MRESRVAQNKDILKTVGYSSIYLFLPLLLGFGGYTLFRFSVLSEADHPTLVGIGLAFAIYGATIISLHFIIGQIKSHTRRALELIETRNESVADIIENKLTTTIETLPGPESVIGALATLYDEATAQDSAGTTEKNLAEVIRNFADRDKNERTREPLITYFGAATITPTEEQKKEAEAFDEYQSSHVDRYFKANEDLHSSNVGFRRYVRFFEVPSFGRRSPEIRARYLEWMSGQIELIESNENYILYNSRRAPRFLALSNFVIGPSTYIGILGGGKSGFRIRGATFASEQLEFSWDYIFPRREDLFEAYRQHSGLDDLRQHFEELEAFHREELNKQSTDSNSTHAPKVPKPQKEEARRKKTTDSPQ